MTPYRIASFLASFAVAASLSSCGGGKSTTPDPALAQAAQAAAAAQAMAAPVKAGEFTLTITPDSDAASAHAIPVHVLSVSSGQATQYKVMGADNYWKSPSGGAQSRVFGTSGTGGTATFSVPSKEGADTIIIIAKLPPSAGGAGDARILEIPLKRQPGADPLKPTAPPISVRLGRLGLLPN